jgi:hypothetical protein
MGKGGGMWEPDFSLLGDPVMMAAPPPPRPRPALLAAPPPKRCMTESVPYAERPVVLPKPVDASRLFRHAGLMREIGGVQGFLKIVRGTHRFPKPSEDGFL